jgi:hypothetical protein
MTAVIWANVLLAIPFLIAFIGVPLWMTFKRPQTGPDHAQAHAYLRAKVAFAEADAAPAANGARTGRRLAARATTSRQSLATPRRDHAREPFRHAGASV